MEINKELISKVAKNARLKLTDKETEEFVPQFKEILNSFSSLDKVKTEGVKPSFHPVDIRGALREDTPRECIKTEELLKNTKHKKGNYFLGPKAL